MKVKNGRGIITQASEQRDVKHSSQPYNSHLLSPTVAGCHFQGWHYRGA